MLDRPAPRLGEGLLRLWGQLTDALCTLLNESGTVIRVVVCIPDEDGVPCWKSACLAGIRTDYRACLWSREYPLQPDPGTALWTMGWAPIAITVNPRTLWGRRNVMPVVESGW